MIKKYSHKDIFLSSGFVEKYKRVFGNRKTSVSFNENIAKVSASSDFVMYFDADKKSIRNRIREVLSSAEYFAIRDKGKYLTIKFDNDETGTFSSHASGGMIFDFLQYQGKEREIYYNVKTSISGKWSLVKNGKSIKIEVEYLIEPISDLQILH